MKPFGLFAASLALASAHAASALSIAPRSSSPRVIGLPIERKDVHPLDHDRNRRHKRTSAISETLDNEQTLYFANVTMGTPAQTLRLHIDTGSSDLWCNVANSQLCESAVDECSASGTYNPAASSTYKFLNSDFNISYVDGSGALGDYVTDTLSIGGQTLAGFQFGVGLESSSAEGVLGIGYPSNEIQVNRLNEKPYPNLPQAMVNTGLIESNAFSLWLNDLEANTGQLLFGGIDTAKFTGALSTVPIVQELGTFIEFIVALTDLNLTSSGSNSNAPSSKSFSTSSSLPAPVLLDSGSSLCYLPDDITEDIYNEVNAVLDSQAGVAYVPCSMANDPSATLDFSFSGATVSVPFNELVLEVNPSSGGGQPTFQDGVAACVFGIAPAAGSTPVLGDTFLRSAYVVYDLANNEISLAQTNFNAVNDDIRQIGTGSNGVPGATPVANPVTSVVAGPGGARLGGPTGATMGFGFGATAQAVPTQVPMAMAAGAIVGAIFAAL